MIKIHNYHEKDYDNIGDKIIFNIHSIEEDWKSKDQLLNESHNNDVLNKSTTFLRKPVLRWENARNTKFAENVDLPAG